MRRRNAGALLRCAMVALLLGSAQLSGARGSDEVELFRRGWEAFDFERWGKAALYFSAALDENPMEGSVRPFDPGHSPHIQVPYLPHFFFGATLFELGKYEEALAEWRLSASGDRGALRASVARRERRKLPRLVDRFREQALPESFRRLSIAVEEARPTLAALERAAEGLEPEERQEIRDATAVLAASLPAGDELGALESDVRLLASSAAADSVDAVLSRYQDALAVHRRVLDAGAAVAEVSRQLDELYVTTRRRLLDGLRGEATFARVVRPSRRVEPAAAGRLGPRARAAAGSTGRSPEEQWSEFVQAKLLVDSGACFELAIELLEKVSENAGPAAPFAIEGLGWQPDLYLARAYGNCNRKQEARAALQRVTRAADEDAWRRIRAWVEAEDPWYGGTSHALVVGAWDYEHWPRLAGVAEDYRALLEILDARGFETVGLANPTIEDLERELARLRRRLGHDDLFFFYYAGHGFAAVEERRGVEEGIFVGIDAPPPPSGVDRETRVKYGIELLPKDERSRAFGLSMADFENWATREIAPRHAILIIDSCFSGSVINQADLGMLRMPEIRSAPSYLERALRNPATLFITAGTAEERIPSASPFRLALVRELEGRKPESAGKEPDAPIGYLYGSQLAQRLMIRATSKRQTPIARMVEGSKAGDIVFRVPGEWISEEQRVAAGTLHHTDALTLSLIWKRYHQRRDYAGYLAQASQGLALTHRDFETLANEFLRRRPLEVSRAGSGATLSGGQRPVSASVPPGSPLGEG